MKTLRKSLFYAFISLMILGCSTSNKELSSWNNTMKSHLKEVVKNAPKEGRIAVFDMDGTMITESPRYLMADFINQNIKIEYSNKEQLIQQVKEFTNREDYMELVDQYVNTKEILTYQPMLEVVHYLKENDFKIVLCTGSEQYFAKKVQEKAFPEFDKVIGSVFELRLNDKEGKVLNLSENELRPMLSFGNSTGDFAMMEYTTLESFLLIKDHQDYKEYDEPMKYKQYCENNGYTPISLKEDWKSVF